MKKKILILAVILIAVILVIIAAIISRQKTGREQNGLEKLTNQQNTDTPSAEVTVDISAEEETVKQEEIILPVAKVQEINGDAIPSAAVKLTVSNSGFSPSQFTVKANEKVVLTITSADNNNLHTFLFLQDPTMASVNAIINSGSTQLLEFIAPKAGKYIFQDDQSANQGTMIVK